MRKILACATSLLFLCVAELAQAGDKFSDIAVPQASGYNQVAMTIDDTMSAAKQLDSVIPKTAWSSGNGSFILQFGSYNSAQVDQVGTRNVGFIAQNGHFNSAAIQQKGVGNEAIVVQRGTGNTAVVTQR